MSLHKAVVNDPSAGMRLDLFVTQYLTEAVEQSGLSRSGIQKLIAEGKVTLNGRAAKSSVRLKVNDVIAIESYPAMKADLMPEALPLNILYEDEDCIVINKAAGMVVHPAAGRKKGTLVNALLHHCPHLEGVGGARRPGIVHRLDKDTSGVMIVAKSAIAFQRLARQFKDRQVKKEYLALVWGKLKDRQGIINRPIGRHRSDRKRMSTVHCLSKKREAITEWSLEQSYQSQDYVRGSFWVSLLRLKPRTGRTHQIRVHLMDLGYPLVGDKIYGRKSGKGNRNGQVSPLDFFPRQALHAETLGIIHPRTGAPMEFRAPLSEDILGLLKTLE